MKSLLLIHQNKIEHYRVPIYNYLSDYLFDFGYKFQVLSENVEDTNPHSIGFTLHKVNMTTKDICAKIKFLKPDVIILFVNLKNKYLFPTLLISKLLKIKIIYWGHGLDLEDKKNKLKNFFYSLQHYWVDAIVLYAEHLKVYISKYNHPKTFVANNTLNTTIYNKVNLNSREILNKYNIKTKKNIIFLGRLQYYKRINDLISAFSKLNIDNVGLIIAGQDIDGVLDNISHKNIYRIDSVYGEDAIRLLSSCDIYCLPGAVGLSIVDAFYCGLPLVTEDVDHGPEIAYLKNGVNGFVVRKGDISALAKKLELLIQDEVLLERMSEAARETIKVEGHISKMANGFREALDYVSL